MKTFKSYLQEIHGLKFIYENLQIQSSIGRKYLLNQMFITDASLLQKELDLLEESVIFLQDKSNTSAIESVNRTLQQINDISSTIIRLEQQQVLDDIELFEIKKFCLLSQQINNLLQQSKFQSIFLKDTEPVIQLLDPENTRIPHFYIYSAYDKILKELRKKITNTTDPNEAEKYRLKSIKREDKIRANLSGKLLSYQKVLEFNLKQIAILDILWAKAAQALKFNFCKPDISIENTTYSQLFNPEIKDILESSSKKFQSVDIMLYPNSCLITGANMSGKTVLLKTIALAQYLFQFGFYVPATQASILPVEEVCINIGDHQSEANGLSSFADEILKINQIIKKVKKGESLLVLIDELARTTNPQEGKALVSAFIQIMSEYKVMSLITTHYSGIHSPTRKLRVKGLKIANINQNITPETLNDYMDYSLVETQNEDVPMEALKIAEIFEVDKEFLELAKEMMGNS
jgi:dsDNA-specific endonuclease/ATPase MutS2